MAFAFLLELALPLILLLILWRIWPKADATNDAANDTLQPPDTRPTEHES